MKKTLFLIFSGVIVIFSIICISSGPIINKTIPNAINWRSQNCQKLADEYKIAKDTKDDKIIKNAKKAKNECLREKAMYGLEYSSLIIDVVLGLVCTILGLMHYFDVAKPFEKITGIIGLSSGIIGFIITLVYVSFSGYIFTKHPYEDSNGNKEIYKANDDYAFAKKENNTHFKCLFFKENDDDSVFAKYSDLGKKLYNYNKIKSKEFEDQDSNFYLCSTVIFNPSMCISTEYTPVSPGICDTYYIAPDDNFENKYLFDKWTTSIIFSCLITVCDIGLAIFGFLLFKSDG
jgi:hypothetical protein